MGKINYLKNNIKYKELRCLFKDMLGRPDFSDIIKDGVSLKWYPISFYSNTTESFRENLKENIMKEIPRIFFTYFYVQVKLLPEQSSDNSPSPLYRNRNRRVSGRVLRILIRRNYYE